MIRTATLSPCGTYRYTLTREWDAALPRVLFVMLNPSTADADVDDPTIRRCIGFAKRDGFGSLEVVNLYAVRATRPTDLWSAMHADYDLATGGTVADRHIAAAVTRAGSVVAAWGATAPPAGCLDLHRIRIQRVFSLLTWRPSVLCLGTTKDGHPRHPLYLRSDAPLTPWALR